MIISVLQMNPRLAASMAEVHDNMRKSEVLLHQAWEMASELIVFPELCFTGYSFLSRDEAARVCEKADGPTFRFMQDTAVSLKSYVAWGYIESDGKYLYNAATITGPDGRVVARYRKINLWGTDYLWAKPGKESAQVAQTELGLLSVVVCRDLRDKIPDNIPRTASGGPPLFGSQKVDVVAACVNWGKGGFPSTSWMDFAADNNCILAAANRWGKEENGSFTQDFGQGGSCVIEPNWTVHTNGLKFNQDCVITAHVEEKIEKNHY